ncbi:hypothetical protein POM88_000223 [Heracleum sosnowskyi]|uniref:PDZ domain-containing protein n=1 Tax=Heracleum sosnowskyi TaxID=360622 RepID=A0AAD8JCL2_9APIA|nr:hypothetical protein POM88_000223 [Heracleum sosnowskyi]
MQKDIMYRRFEGLKKRKNPWERKPATPNLFGQLKTCVQVNYDYNLAVIRFTSIPPSGAAKVAKVARVYDSVDVYSHQTSRPPSHLLPHSRSHKLIPGDRVIVMGRYFAEPFEPMAAPGLKRYHMIAKSFSVRIAKSQGRKCRRPFLGFEAASLFAADIGLMERVIHSFPDAPKGLVIEKIVPDSPAYLAGLHVGDVIVKCDRKPVQSFLELFEILLEKVGVPIELSLIRAGDDTLAQLNIVFVEATSAQLNRWPVHKQVLLRDVHLGLTETNFV